MCQKPLMQYNECSIVYLLPAIANPPGPVIHQKKLTMNTYLRYIPMAFTSSNINLQMDPRMGPQYQQCFPSAGVKTVRVGVQRFSVLPLPRSRSH